MGFVYVNQFDRDIHIDAMSKVAYKLTNHLMQFVNATVTYSIVTTWGYKNQKTGEWTGLVGALQRNEADIAVSPMVLTSERLYIVDYLTRPTFARAAFIFRAPKLSYTNNIYLLPFDRFLWMSVACLVVLIVICLGGAVMIEMKVFSNLEVRFSKAST